MSLLLGNRLRKKVLTYSFLHSNEDFYVREMASYIDEDPGNLSRELKKLEQEGLFTSRVRGREKFFALNMHYPLLEEVKKIVLNTEGLTAQIKDVVNAVPSITHAFIYGSYVQGNMKKTSDIDIVVVGDVPAKEMNRKLHAIEQKINREINTTTYTQAEFDQEKQKKGSFLALILQNKIIILKGAPCDR